MTTNYPIALMNDFGLIKCNIVETGQAYGAYGSVSAKTSALS
jgi:hypothetical protein